MTIDTHDTATVDAFPAKPGRGRPRSLNPKTPAQRMAESRRRRREAGEGERRLDLWISSEAFFALERLVVYDDSGFYANMTKQAMLEKLILDFESGLTRQMDDEQFDAFINRNRPHK